MKTIFVIIFAIFLVISFIFNNTQKPKTNEEDLNYKRIDQLKKRVLQLEQELISIDFTKNNAPNIDGNVLTKEKRNSNIKLAEQIENDKRIVYKLEKIKQDAYQNNADYETELYKGMPANIDKTLITHVCSFSSCYVEIFNSPENQRDVTEHFLSRALWPNSRVLISKLDGKTEVIIYETEYGNEISNDYSKLNISQ